jgi:flagellar motor switch protein FliG
MTLPAPTAGSAAAETSSRITETRVLSGAEKVAALLLAMDKKTAARILSRFEPDDIKLMAQTATDLGQIPKATIDAVIEEFASSIKSGGGLHATAEQVEGLLSGIIPPDKLHEIMSGIRNKTGAGPVWGRLVELPLPTLTQHFAKEHPQATALVLSRTPAAFAASLLKQFPMGLQKEITRRLLAMRPVSEKPLRMLEENIAVELLVNVGRNTVVSIHAKLADIINKMDRTDSESVLQVFDEHKPKDAELIRQLLFTFEDIARLSSEALTVLLDNVPAERVTIMLHGAPAQLKDMILQAVPARSRRMIEQDLETGPRPKTKDVNKARRALADLALDMIERGIIDMGSRDGEEDD